MAGDAQRRFEKLMSKLSHPSSPRQTQPSTSSGLIARTRAESGLRVSTNSIGSAPQCRPWDRRDLMRRLATFKAMTWFGKPKAINPVNCARRGWINIETDVIFCESCGARLLFSTSSSWTQQQVEKAAAVFSLKLDNGHKLLCPWIDNACDEKLALFPPTPLPALVDGYRERSAALLQLTALPVISPATINYMKSPKLEHFLSQSSSPPITLENGVTLADYPSSRDLVAASEDTTANIYPQALKIISLCGWEPRLLPYVVDSEDLPSQSLGEAPGEPRNGSIICTSEPTEVEGGNSNWPILGENQYDPASVVLDCCFCGARVGLWAFATVQRPLEYFTLITEPRGQNESVRTCKADHGASSTSKERPMVLNFTIAGGPPPTKQNFRPVVSFPIVSRHLRYKFASNSGIQDYLSSQLPCGNHENSKLHSQIDVSSQQHKSANGDLVVFSEDTISLKRKRNEDELIVSGSNYLNDHSQSEKEIQGNGLGIRDKQRDIASDGKNQDSGEVHSLNKGAEDVANSEEMHSRSGDSQRNGTYSEGTEGSTLQKEGEVPNHVEVGENVSATSDADVIIRDSEACGTNSDIGLGQTTNSQDDSMNNCGISEHDCDRPLDTTSNSTIDAPLPTSSSTDTGIGDRNSDFKDLQIAKAYDQKTSRLESMLPPANGNEKADHALGKTLVPPLHRKRGEFDPIRQHRPFCPWIAPGDGESLPGWRLVLNALIQQEKWSSSEQQQLDSTSTLNEEADDPIVSIRKLFMPPPSKRLKGAR